MNVYKFDLSVQQGHGGWHGKARIGQERKHCRTERSSGFMAVLPLPFVFVDSCLNYREKERDKRNERERGEGKGHGERGKGCVFPSHKTKNQ